MSFIMFSTWQNTINQNNYLSLNLSYFASSPSPRGRWSKKEGWRWVTEEGMCACMLNGIQMSEWSSNSNSALNYCFVDANLFHFVLLYLQSDFDIVKMLHFFVWTESVGSFICITGRKFYCLCLHKDKKTMNWIEIQVEVLHKQWARRHIEWGEVADKEKKSFNINATLNNHRAKHIFASAIFCVIKAYDRVRSLLRFVPLLSGFVFAISLSMFSLK